MKNILLYYWGKMTALVLLCIFEENYRLIRIKFHLSTPPHHSFHWCSDWTPLFSILTHQWEIIKGNYTLWGSISYSSLLQLRFKWDKVQDYNDGAGLLTVNHPLLGLSGRCLFHRDWVLFSLDSLSLKCLETSGNLAPCCWNDRAQ